MHEQKHLNKHVDMPNGCYTSDYQTEESIIINIFFLYEERWKTSANLPNTIASALVLTKVTRVPPEIT